MLASLSLTAKVLLGAYAAVCLAAVFVLLAWCWGSSRSTRGTSASSSPAKPGLKPSSKPAAAAAAGLKPSSKPAAAAAAVAPRSKPPAPPASKPPPPPPPAPQFKMGHGPHHHHPHPPAPHHPASSPLNLATLKGHAGPVTACAWRSDGLLVATASDDRAVRAFAVGAASAGGGGGQGHPQRINVEGASRPTALAFVGLDLAVVASAPSGAASLRLYRGVSSPGASSTGTLARDPSWEVPSLHGTKGVLALAAADAGLLATCSSEGTEVGLFSARQSGARVGATLDTNGLVNHAMAASPDGAFVAVGAWTADCRLWQVSYDKLTGHPTGAKAVLPLKVCACPEPQH